MPQKETGVYQRDDGFWEYRFVIKVNGIQIARKKSTDQFGNKLKTKKQAIQARALAIQKAREERISKPVITRRTVEEIYTEYCEKGRRGRAYQTIRKQDSLWRNHLCKRFGSRFVDSLSTAEIIDYLTELYYVNNYSYQYTESFLKMFYLIFGQAYSRNYLDIDIYNKLCINKDTKIKMPKMKIEDDEEIIAFTDQQLALLDNYFAGTNAETAYLLGKYCGLRINETFGLKWSNVDLESKTIYIDRQMQYQEGLIKLVPPKTRNAKRYMQLNDILLAHLTKLAEQRKEDEVRLAALRKQRARLIEDLDGQSIVATELVTCLPDGRIQTVNSMKYPSREIKEKLGFDFKYHYLRHTYGTRMADMGTPPHLLCNQMGHGNIRVTHKYYLALSEGGVELLRNNLNRL